LLDGLEATEINLSEILKDDNLRLEAEFFVSKVSQKSNFVKGVQIIDFVQYGTSEELNEERKGFPILRLNEFESYFIGEPAKYCSNISTDTYNNLKLKKGDVLICRTNGNPNLVGKSAIVAEDTDIAFASYLYRVRPKEEYINSETLLIYLHSNFGRNQINKYSMTSNQTNFSPAKFREIDIPLFSIELQTQIKKIVKTAYSKLEQSKSLYREAETLLLRELGLDNWQPPKETAAVKSFSDSFGKSGRLDAEYYQPQVINLLEILHKQKHIKLYQSCNIVNGYAWKSEYFLESENEGFEEGEPFVRIRNCKPGALDIEGLSRLKKDYVIKQNNVEKARSGDIVIGMDGLKWFYASLIVSPCYVNQRVCWLRLNDNYLITPEYLTLFINTIAGQNQLLREMTIADTVGHITNQSVGNIIVPLLSNEKIKKITMMLKNSVTTKFESQRLLELAKKAVETAIEQGEEKAIKEILCPEKICIMKL